MGSEVSDNSNRTDHGESMLLMMLVCTDVDYRPDDSARAAAIFFEFWADETPALERVQRIEQVAPYQPGQFYQRELPCLLAVLSGHLSDLEAVIIDGYVSLDARGRKGLGQYLFEALGTVIPVIGVAKTAFQGSPHALHLRRGNSQTPLYVTAAGIDVQEAAQCIQGLHGLHRMPTLLKRVDRLCRDAD